MKKYVSFLICVIMAISSSMAVSASETTVNTTLTINEEEVIKSASKAMLGYNNDASWYTDFAAAGGVSAEYDEELFEFIHDSGLMIPMLRLFIHHKNFDWKKGIGDASNRTGGPYSETYTYGLSECIKSMQKLNPDIEFSFTVNMDDTPEDLADLVRYLTLMPDDENAVGSDGVNWAAKRVEAGIYDPVKICAIELGNEWDNGHYEDESNGIFEKEAPQEYIDLCIPVIEAIRNANPDVKIAGIACSNPTTYTNNNGLTNYQFWNSRVVPALDGLVDYFIAHYYPNKDDNFGKYYLTNRTDLFLEDYYDEPAGGNRPTVFMSEYATFTSPTKTFDPDYRDTPGDLNSALMTAEMLALCFNNYGNGAKTDLIAHHSLFGDMSSASSYGGHCWGIVRPFGDGKYVLNVPGELYRMITPLVNGYVVESKLTSSSDEYIGYETSDGLTDGRLNAVAFLEKEGCLNIILVNRNASVSHDVSFNFNCDYYAESISVLTSDSKSDANNLENENKVFAKTYLENTDSIFKSYTVPAKSVVAIRLKTLTNSNNGNIDVAVNRKYISSNEAEVTVGEDFTVNCTLAEDGGLKDTDALMISVYDENGNIVYLNQKENIVRKKTSFTLSLKDEGTYTAYIGNGEKYERFTLNCVKNDKSDVEILSIDDNSEGSYNYHAIVRNDDLHGKPCVIQVKNTKSGELAYYGTGALSAYMEGKFNIPDYYPLGEYTFSILYENEIVSKTLTYLQNGDGIYLMSSPETNGKVIDVQALKKGGTVSFSLKGSVENEPTNVFLAFYDLNGNLTDSAVCDDIKFENGTAEIDAVVSPLQEQAAYARLFVWDKNTLEPLTKVYIVKETEGSR